MSLWDLVLAGLRHRRVATGLNALAVALSVGLVCAFLAVQSAVERRLSGPGRGYGLVVGAPGSALQLVLSAVFYTEESTGRVPLALWEELVAHPSVALVVPQAVGDSFRGFPVVATTGAFFDPRVPHPEAAHARGKLERGRPLVSGPVALDAGSADADRADADHGRREAVVGAAVASALGLRVGDRIEPSHGAEDGAAAHAHEALWEVVGVLRSTGTSVDELVLINLDSFYGIAEHEASADAALSSLLVFPRRGVHTAMLLGELRGRSDLQVAQVSAEVRRLLDRIGRFDVLFGAAVGLSVILAVLGIFTSTYTGIRARRGELGVLRALGMPRARLLGLVVGEGALVALAGALAGWAAGHGLVLATGDAIETLAGVRPAALGFRPATALVVGGVTLAGALAGLLPGLQAYRMDVAGALRQAE